MKPDAIGERIKRLREARDMSQRQLALATKLPQSHLSQIENGVRPGSGMRVDAARRIAFALGCHLMRWLEHPWMSRTARKAPPQSPSLTGITTAAV